MHADLHSARVVFGAVEDDYLAIPDDRGGVEGVERLPMDRSAGDWVIKESRFIGGYDGRLDGTIEGADLPGEGRLLSNLGRAEQRGSDKDSCGNKMRH